LARVLANSVVTGAFFMTTNSVRSRVHFFPSSGATAGHYPVACELTIFGKGIESRSVRLDGGRLNQPDGIRLEDAFPSLLSETSGLCGLQVVLETSQGRLNLVNSRVVIEMVSPQFSLSFSAAPCRPRVVADDEASTDAKEFVPEQEMLLGLAVNDQFLSPSLVAVNAGDELLRPELRHVLRDSEVPLHVGTIAGRSVVEFPLDETLCKQGVPHEALWGSTVVEKFWGEMQGKLADVSWYLLNRHPVTKRPLSVCAL
jgi:hypothetical protein